MRSHNGRSAAFSVVVVAAMGAALGAALEITTTSAHAQPVRLELRLVPQSGAPGPFAAPPVGCVYDDPPEARSPVRADAGVAKRFEVQYRLIDTDPADGLTPAGLAGVTFSLHASPSTGVWGRARLSGFEQLILPPLTAAPPPGTVDCRAIPISQHAAGLHTPFRGLLTGVAPADNDDADNGVFQGGVFADIRAFSTEPNRQGVAPSAAGAWYGLFSCEFTPGNGPASSVHLSIEPARPGPGGVTFEWFARTGQGDLRLSGMTPVVADSLTLQTPAGPLACCEGGICTIALSPSACFARAGRAAPGGVCASNVCCRADLSGDGVLAVQDVLTFVSRYAAGDASADWNMSGQVTIDDVYAFLAEWYGGCT